MSNLIETGLGMRLVGTGGICPSGESLRKMLLTHGTLLVEGLRLSKEQFSGMLTSLGDMLVHKGKVKEFGYGYKDILHLDGSREQEKVITGRGPIPLHTDGLLAGNQVDFIVLYCHEADILPDSGSTVVCDQSAAWQAMPDALRKVIKDGTFEYFAEERGYFPTVPESWYSIPTKRNYGRIESLNLALPFPAGWHASWQVRVRGNTEAENTDFFQALGNYLWQPHFIYRHQWKEGDLLLIDNQNTLHAREPLSDDSRRKLYRGQVTIS